MSPPEGRVGGAVEPGRRRRRGRGAPDRHDGGPTRGSVPARGSVDDGDVDAGWEDDDLAEAAATTLAAARDPRAATDEPDADDAASAGDRRWGDDSDDDDTTTLVLAADLPGEPDADDPDPVTALLDELGDCELPQSEIRNVVGAKFSAAGKIYEFDGADDVFARGDEVMVDTERGPRLAIVAVPSVRVPHRARELRRVLRRAGERDRSLVAKNQDRAQEGLAVAREAARRLRLPIKVFRAELGASGGKLLVYFSSEERVSFRDLARELEDRMRCRVELRQTGVRDEAKAVGGIGSCGRELCCTTFLPAFAPVSIKMAKDQNLVLNPSKVSGQCGRLKCCLVYEQAAYAELRRGLPKVGKRVLVETGEEARVVEVDVLRQRVRVALLGGDFETLAAHQVKPMFPSGPAGPEPEPDAGPEPEPEPPTA
jgi:cell fate regulator YaaT (PSP1 superfamily)